MSLQEREKFSFKLLFLKSEKSILLKYKKIQFKVQKKVIELQHLELSIQGIEYCIDKCFFTIEFSSIQLNSIEF